MAKKRKSKKKGPSSAKAKRVRAAMPKAKRDRLRRGYFARGGK